MAQSPSLGSVRQAATGADQVSPKGAMGLGRGPGRFLLGGEVLLGQLGDPIADPDALHRIRAAVSEPP